MKIYRRKKKVERTLSPEQQAQRNTKKYKKRLRMKKRNRALSLCVFVAVIIGLFMCFAPFFDIKTINVKGNVKVKTESIIQTARIFKGENIWTFGSSGAEKRVEKYPYIYDAQITKTFPNKITITVKEYEPYGFVKVKKGLYILVARNGQILQQVTKPSTKLKEIKISKLAGKKIGEKFVTEKSLGGKAYKEILSYLKKEGYEKDVKKIEISGDDVRFKYNNLTVIIGEMSNIEYKFAFLKTFIRERGIDVEGSFDISAPSVGGYYKENYDENEKLITASEKRALEEAEKKETQETEEPENTEE
ncbi:MAG: FtsQ-type POTRA domain-containing protein [Eubacteriales bacterium]|nr:FtsQ-type POTRA domain-containing protein [Eubacteriales bacterium]